jgi:hypothetical protein
MNKGAGPPPLLGLAAALVVLIAGIAAATTRDDSTTARTEQSIVASTRPLPASATSASTATTTLTTAPGTSTHPTFSTLPPSVLSTTSTTVRPDVPKPEAAANGLWSAYSIGDRDAAVRFASEDVVTALFDWGYSDDDRACEQSGRCGFRSCTAEPSQTTFTCVYEELSARYEMRADRADNGSYHIGYINIDPSRAIT